MQIGSNVSDDLVQIITLFICLIGIVLWLHWGRGRAGYAIVPVSYLAHRVLFYFVLIAIPDLPTNVMAIWASALALHSVITITLAAVIMLIIRRRGD